MNNANDQLKLRSEDGFPMNVIRTFLSIPLDKSWGAQLSSWLKEKNRQVWMMQEMNSKCNESKKISASIRDK